MIAALVGTGAGELTAYTAVALIAALAFWAAGAVKRDE